MSDGRNQRPPGYGGGRGSSFFDSFFGGDPFAHMDQMFRGMGMGGDLFGGFTGGTGTFQVRTAAASHLVLVLPCRFQSGCAGWGLHISTAAAARGLACCAGANASNY